MSYNAQSRRLMKGYDESLDIERLLMEGYQRGWMQSIAEQLQWDDCPIYAGWVSEGWGDTQ